MNNKRNKIFIGVLKRFFLTLFGLIFLYFIFAALLSVLPTHPKSLNCQPDKQIFITTNGVHLDIIIPKKRINPQLLKQLNVASNTRFVSFGWGDKQFYLNTPEWSDLTFPVAFRALFLKSESAMHVTPYNSLYKSWNEIKICDQQLQTLNRYIADSFDMDESGKIIKIDVAGYGYNDYFYKANNSFTVFRTCNIWVNTALKEINVKTSVWSPFDFGVLYHLP